MKPTLPVTSNWDNGNLDGLIGKIEFMDTARANFFYELLKMRPDQHRFEIGYSENPHGTFTLLEVSLVSKYGKNHPVTLYRRIKDKVRVWLRNHKKTN